jgi:serine/threonine protein kinase
VHGQLYIHRDIKPVNFLTGRNKEVGTLYLIDFGVARQYRNPETKEHLAFKEGKRLTGTADYCSINTHKRIEQSRRDDLESMCYSIIQMLKGSLPWSKFSGKTTEERFEKIMNSKISCTADKLCEGLPSTLTLNA